MRTLGAFPLPDKLTCVQESCTQNSTGVRSCRLISHRYGLFMLQGNEVSRLASIHTIFMDRKSQYLEDISSH